MRDFIVTFVVGVVVLAVLFTANHVGAAKVEAYYAEVAE